jgi:hypothetical protein
MFIFIKKMGNSGFKGLKKKQGESARAYGGFNWKNKAGDKNCKKPGVVLVIIFSLLIAFISALGGGLVVMFQADKSLGACELDIEYENDDECKKIIEDYNWERNFGKYLSIASGIGVTAFLITFICLFSKYWKYCNKYAKYGGIAGFIYYLFNVIRNYLFSGLRN